MKNFNQKLLSAAVSMFMTASICQVATTQASDIDIYKLPDQTKMTLFLMFDTSGSMGVGKGYNTIDSANNASSLVEDYNICSWSNNTWTNANIKSETKTYKVGARTAKNYTVDYCDVSQTTYNNLNSIYKTRIANECTKTSATTDTYKCYDRLSRLKTALAQVLASSEIDDSVRIGLGQFSTPTSNTSTTTKSYTGRVIYGHDGRSGRVIYPAVTLNDLNREALIDEMVRLEAYNGTPSAAAYGESGAYFLGANTSGLTYSGYSYSQVNSRDGSKGYKAPLTTTEMANTCNGQGIYFLTDGVANNSDTSSTQAIMNKSISLSGTGMSGGASTAGWTEIGKYSKLLRSGNRNIKTAVVGFGSSFPNGSTYVKDLPVDILDQDGDVVETVNRRFYDCSKLPSSTEDEQSVKNTCNWGAKTHNDLPNSVGGFGNGGFYSAQSTQDIVNSIKYFIEDIRPRFKPVATGSPTLPVDALNPIQLQPYGYYANFTPKPQSSYQLWLGNLNKYHIYNGELYNSAKTIKLILDNGRINTNAQGIFGGEGVSGKIPLRDGLNTEGTQYSKRQVFTNRQITNGVVSESSDLQVVDLETLFSADTSKAKFANDPKKNYWLNVLGYGVGENQTNVTQASLANIPEVRQMGAVMHSKPLLLTQGGKVVASKVTGSTKPVITSTDRKDYLLYGTNQGMLHVVYVGKDTDDDERGKEVFTFVPNEMMENQYKGFLAEGNTNGGRQNLYYGIDGTWTSHTQYVSKTDGSLTVKDSGRKDNDGKDLDLKGLQWVYGGLRMGGRSYYALDLSTIDKPTLKFHINPTGTGSDSNPLGYMGESWSKPTVTWVNWGGARKLVMFVGGGYDRTGGDGSGYENPAYDQTNSKGAGVYMFDAGNGELLWWASANAGTSTGAAMDSGIIKTNDNNLKYSVVSQINAVDRDADGLSDHLYFGDLGGQAFRIDLNNKAATKGAFAKRVVRLYDGHATDGASPRFYEMPSFSVHKGVDGMFGALALSSGNRSSPLAGTNNVSGSTVVNTTANDAVYVIYDNDVARSDLYSTNSITLRTSPASAGVTLVNAVIANLKAGIAQTTTTGKVTTYNGGWKYHYSNDAGKYKGMNELYALDGMLYVNVYHKDGTGITGSCGSGVIGDTELYQFCLPTGKCSFYNGSTTGVNKVVLGGGILGTGLGAGYSNKTDESGLIVPRPNTLDCTTDANKNLPQCQLFDTGARLQHLRWFESR